MVSVMKCDGRASRQSSEPRLTSASRLLVHVVGTTRVSRVFTSRDVRSRGARSEVRTRRVETACGAGNGEPRGALARRALATADATPLVRFEWVPVQTRFTRTTCTHTHSGHTAHKKRLIGASSRHRQPAGLGLRPGCFALLHPQLRRTGADDGATPPSAQSTWLPDAPD
jgi:hypothetical protein